jgi:flagellar basal-body rod modification protein FlgD
METGNVVPLEQIAALRELEEARNRADPTKLGQDEFMKLLVAKLANQDPLNPTEDTEFISQLATFSSLEQLVDVNGNLENLGLGQANIINAQALDLIGRNALVESGNQMRVKGGSPDPLVYIIPTEASSATLSIINGEGTTIKVIELDRVPRGRVELNWDGTDANGNPVPDGDYRLRVDAKNLENEPMQVGLFRSLPIDGVNFLNGNIGLISGDREIPFSQILEIRAGNG